MANLQQRSTKGASKQRRDNINSEVSIIRSLLPLPDAVRHRLSQLQVMSMCKSFMGKSNLLCTMNNDKSELVSQLWDFTQALPGFMLIIDSIGSIVYLTENTVEYLAHSMVDIVSQSENILEIVHPDDKTMFSDAFKPMPSLPGLKVFSCRMGLMKHPRRNHAFDKYKMMKVSGKLVSSNDSGHSYFVALCTPQLDCVMASEPAYLFDTLVFKSTHTMDMKLTGLDQNGEHHLGYSGSQIHGMSWYSIIHPENLDNAVRKHTELLRSNYSDSSVSLNARVQRSDGSMVWLHVVMKKETLDGKDNSIVCWNQVLHPDEVNSQPGNYKMVNSTISPESYNLQMVQGRKNEQLLKREYVPEGEHQEGKKMDRSELIEKLKKKMKKNEGEVESKLFDDNSKMWQFTAKSEPKESNNFENCNALSTAQNGLDLSSQPFGTLNQADLNFLLPPPKQEANVLMTQTYDQAQKSKNNQGFFPIVPSNQQAMLPSTQHSLPPSYQQPKNTSNFDSELTFLQNSLPNNTMMNNNSNDFINNNFNSNFNNNMNNNNFINNNFNNPHPSSLDSRSTAGSSFSYAASSPYSATSPRNSEDLNTQSFFGQVDEIKSEFALTEYNLETMLNEPCKFKTHHLLAPKSSFPELELQDVDDCLKLLEGPESIKIESNDSSFDTPFGQLPYNSLDQYILPDQIPSEEAFNFSDDLSHLNDGFGYLNELNCFSSFVDPSTPAAGLQAHPMMAF